MTRIWYASMTRVKRAADIPSSVDQDYAVAEALDEGSEAVDGLCRRYFYPEQATRYFAWPQDDSQSSQRLYLGKHGLITVDTLVNGDGSTIASNRYHLAPARYGPPYTKIEIDGAFATNGVFPDRSIQITGLYGYRLEEQRVTTTTTQLTGAGTGTVTLSDASKVGVGSLIRIGNERLVVEAKGGWVDSGNLVAITLTDKKNADSFTVTSGAAFRVDEDLLIGSEVMRVQRIAGNTLIVRRAVDGSVLQAHAAVTQVMVDRTVTVSRAVLGTTATDTALGASVYLFRFPRLVEQLCRAETLTILGFDRAAYAVASGSDDARIKHSTTPLEDLRERVFEMHGRTLSGAA